MLPLEIILLEISSLVSDSIIHIGYLTLPISQLLSTLLVHTRYKHIPTQCIPCFLNHMIVCEMCGKILQVYCQPLYAFVEKWSAKRWSKSDFVTAEYDIPIPFCGVYQLNFFRVTWRTMFVVVTTVIAMLMPFFNDVVGILGAFGFWPLTVYFPVEMYISQKKIKRWSTRWIALQILSFTCLIVSLAAAVGSVAGVLLDLKTYKPFKTSY